MISEKEVCTIERKNKCVCTWRFLLGKKTETEGHPETSKRKTTKLCLEKTICLFLNKKKKR